jgi:hypothetical protein
MLILKNGLCSIRVQVCSDLMLEHLAEVAQRLDTRVVLSSCSPGYNLMVIPPFPNDIKDSKYRAIAQAWEIARNALRKTGLGGLDSWRSLYNFGIPISPKIFLFQDRMGAQDDFFCLNSGETILPPYRPALWIVKAIEALGLHWHVTHGGAAFHASGVDRNDKGYLFLGQSGAGKSTAASLSGQVHATIVHDDQVLLASVSGQYLISHPDSRINPPLRAVFFLKQSQKDCLVRLTPQATGEALGNSLLEYAIGQDLYGPWVRQAFNNAAAIARAIPGYELHFRKRPDFWKLIDEQFPN